jgi:ligand-binding sensor domain-containing protein
MVDPPKDCGPTNPIAGCSPASIIGESPKSSEMMRPIQNILCLVFYSALLFPAHSQNNEWVTFDIDSCVYALAKYDGSAWQVYTVHNSGLIDNYIYSINIDGTGNIWIGSYIMAAVMFDGENWDWYFDNDHEYPGDTYNVSAFEQDSIVWFGRDYGLSRFNGTLWEFYNISNSGLPDNSVFSILVDEIGNKWIGTREGLAVYNEEGVVQVENQTQNIVKSYSLLQNYPNPFNPTTNIPKLPLLTIL